MTKKNYEEPLMDVQKLEKEDVITTSGIGDDEIVVS